MKKDPLDSMLVLEDTKMNDSSNHEGATMNQCIPFPWKLHEMLDNGYDSIVSWLPDDNSFKVHNTQIFITLVMSQYFKQTKYKSFQRQLNMWGFERILSGPGKGGYKHTNFVRGKSSLCRHMQRRKIKRPSSSSSKEEEGSPSSSPRPSTTTEQEELSIPPSVVTPKAHTFHSRCNEWLASFPSQTTTVPAVAPISRSTSPVEISPSPVKSLSSVYDIPLPSSMEMISDITIPQNGDCVLFEGRNFYFVTDYHQPPASSTQGRRMSLEFISSLMGF
jgi:hypothetical protein